MRPPTTIRSWMPLGKMKRWASDAPDEGTHKRRLAVLLTHTRKLHAREVADQLGVSVQAVWLWNSQYNKKGPRGLDRKGRGGRRRMLMTPCQEKAVLRPFIRLARTGRPVKAAVVKKAVEAKLGRTVSFPYVYSLLTRHGWARIIAESRQSSLPQKENTFMRLATPWRR